MAPLPRLSRRSNCPDGTDSSSAISPGWRCVYTVTYGVALARLGGVDRSTVVSIEFVIQTMTTTGSPRGPPA